MEVTNIALCKKNKNRVNVYVDDKFAFAVYAETAAKYGIKKGKVLTEPEKEEILGVDGRQYGVDVGLKFVATKLRTKAEIQKKLAEKGVTEEAAQSTLLMLEEYGYIDDENYAALYTKELAGKYGKRVIEYKLKTKGIPEELAKRVLAEAGGENDALKELAEKQAHRLRGEPEDKRKQKMIRALLSKGFDYDNVKSVVREVLSGED